MEAELRHITEQLGVQSFSNAQLSALFHRILNAASTSQDDTQTLQHIKRLIDQSIMENQLSSPGGTGSDTPPSSGSSPDLSAKADFPRPKIQTEAVWQEFSLEEELEGIADAPAINRATMRAALRQKEDTHLKALRDNAYEKRRIAEHEGRRLKETFQRPSTPTAAPAAPSAPVATKPAQPWSYGPQKRYKYDKAAAKQVPARQAEPKVAAKVEAKATMPAPLIPGIGDMDSDLDGEQAPYPYEQEYCHKKKWFSNLPVTDPQSSFGIISVKCASPKNADRFGIRFNPAKLDSETAAMVGGTGQGNNNRRSVLIQNVPCEFTMHKLLGHVRGGVVVKARLVPDTMGKGHGQVAMITFKTADEAARCMKVTPTLLALSEEDEGTPPAPDKRMTIALLPHPTYPSRETIVEAGSTNAGLVPVEEKTRRLVVENFPRQYINDLCKELLFVSRGFPSKMSALEEMWFAGEDLHILFTSIQEAVTAHRIISVFHFEKYAMNVHYGPDPCAKQVDANNLDSLFDYNGIKVASHNEMGLRTLIDTVGLASYARSYAKGPSPMPTFANQKTSQPPVMKMSFSALLSQAHVQAHVAMATQPQSRTQSGGSWQASSQGSKQMPLYAQMHTQTTPKSSHMHDQENNQLIDISYDDTTSTAGQSQDSILISIDNGPTCRSSSAPWTADLMFGLDQL